VEMGVNAYVKKPFQTQELVSCVDGLLHKSDAVPNLVNDMRRLAA